jgi:hypothetical protein
VVDVEGADGGDALAVVVGQPPAAGERAARYHRRCFDGLGNEDFLAGVAAVGAVFACGPVLELAAGVTLAALRSAGDEGQGVRHEHGLRRMGGRGDGDRAEEEGERGQPAQQLIDHLRWIAGSRS